jgi:arylsulfatase A-like enzyme/tetratricopeptide (TPR) repeat protein
VEGSDRAVRATLWVAVGLALVTGCGRGGDGTHPRANVVLITIDTTRADHLGCYGYDRPTSPHMDALAARSVRFEHCTSHVPITLPAHTSILSGTAPLYNGVRDNGRFVVPEALVTLPEVLAGQGYRTAAFVSAFVLDSRYGLDSGFEVYDDRYAAEWSEEDLRGARLFRQGITDRPADQTTDAALAWLAERGDEPFFLWVHYYDPHQPLTPPKPYDQLFDDNLYDGEIAFMDSQIDRLLGALEHDRLWDDTLVVLTSDHGESLGQHGEETHAVLVYETTLHVVLVIKPPAGLGVGPGVVAHDVCHADILPTVCAVLGVRGPDTVQGRSLLPLLRGEQLPPRPTYFECALPFYSYRWEHLHGIRLGRWKYIHSPTPELYDVDADPGEIYNLAENEPGRVDDLEVVLFEFIRTTPDALRGGSTAIDAATAGRLRALGYATGGGEGTDEDLLNPQQPTGRLDPKEGVVYLKDYWAAIALSNRGNLPVAAAIYENNLLPLDPGNPGFLVDLAELKRRMGEPERAYELYRRALALSPGDATVLQQLAQLEVERGNLDQAEALFASAMAVDPQLLTAVYLAGRLAEQRSRTDEAIELYRRVLAIDDSHAATLINLGVIHAQAGANELARSRLEQALEVSPFSARAHYNLGLLELHTDNAARAVQHLENAIRFRGPFPEARLALGVALLSSGDVQRARELLRAVVEENPSTTAAERARSLLDGLPGAAEANPG